ncbi:MAG: dihydroneopterin aldolase family protein [Methanomassiliicoccales archaeon]|nr:MAG: dihydroneopterin aldolase family protein [Methanomassiliicoccales archaeon]
MPSKREELASKYFKCSLRERAVFESGIKLGTIYHQFVGTPLSSTNVETLEKAIEEGVKVQPFVKDVKVRIDRGPLRKKKDEFDYQTLTGPMLDVKLVIRIEDVEVVSGMRYIDELRYPLMFVESVSGGE